MNKKTKVLATSIATIAMTASLAVGGTYALFTSEDKVNIAVSSGTVKVNANVDETSVVMTSIDQVMAGGVFANGGTAVWAEDTVKLDKITPGDKISFNINITSESNVDVLYRTVISCKDGIELFSGLKVTLDYANDQAAAQVFDGMTAYGAWTELAGAETTTAVDTVAVTVEFPYLTTSQNQYQGLSTAIEFSVEAVQGNADVSDDTAAAGETLAYNANDLKLVSMKAANGYTFKNETIKLGADIDLGTSASTFAMRATPVKNWTPIANFEGTFDGQGHTISNLVSIEENYAGLFGKTNATIKNVTVENAYVSATSYAGAIVGMGYTGRIENCHVKGLVQVSGNYMVGGINGHGYARINNCSVAGTSGSYVTGIFMEKDLEGDNVGGIVGHIAESNSVTNCSVSGIAVSGTRKVGGVVGLSNGGGLIENAVVTNVTVESNADEEYLANNASKIFVGGILGEYNGNVTISGGSIANATVKGLEEKTGASAGGTRSSSATLTGGVKIGDQVTINEGTYAYNEDNMMLYTEGEEVVLYSIKDYTQTGDTFTVPEGVTYVNASMGSLNAKKVVFADTVKKVGRVFDENATLETVVLNEGLEVIGNRAFRKCVNLVNITIPSTVTTIESGAFQTCSSLENVVIPEGVTSIGDQAFYGAGLTSITLPQSLEIIEASAIRATNLTEITIPANVTTIGSMAFRDNYQLTTIHVQCATVPTVGASAFLRAASPMYMRTYYIYNAEVFAEWNKTLVGGEQAKWATYVNAAPVEVKAESAGALKDTLNDLIANGVSGKTTIDATGVETTMGELGVVDGSHIATSMKEGVTIKGLIATFGKNQDFLVQGDGSLTGTVVFENCTFKTTDFSNKSSFQIDRDSQTLKVVFYNCVFEGQVSFAGWDEGSFEVNNCTFKLGAGTGYVQCAGGKTTFNNCTFNYEGGGTFFDGAVTKFNKLNLYCESYSTVVYLNGCDIATHAYKGGNGTNTVVRV